MGKPWQIIVIVLSKRSYAPQPGDYSECITAPSY